MKSAEIQFSKDAPTPSIEVSVPHGTTFREVTKLQEMISKDLITKISPRGCQACLSGFHFTIRERLENVIKVDLASLKVIEGKF